MINQVNYDHSDSYPSSAYAIFRFGISLLITMITFAYRYLRALSSTYFGVYVEYARNVRISVYRLLSYANYLR